MKKILFSIIGVFLLISSVQAANAPQFRGDNFHSGAVSQTLEAPLTVKWSYQTQDKILSSATTYEGIVYFGSRDHHLYAVNVADGSFVWKYKAGHWIDSSAYVNADSVFFTARDGYFYSVKRTDGVLNWKYKSGGSDFSSPIEHDGKIIAGAGFPEKFIYALDINTGEEVWRYETDQPVYSSPALVDGEIIIGSNDGNVYSLNADTGAKNWAYKTKGGVYFASPAIDGDDLYISAGDFDWHVYKINRKDGTLIWESKLESDIPTPNYVSSISVGTDYIFLVAGYDEQYLYALKKSNGQKVWKVALGPSTRFGFSSSPIATEETVYVSSAEGQLKAVEIATGKVVWEYDLGAQVLSSAVISDGKLFIGTMAGKIYCFRK